MEQTGWELTLKPFIIDGGHYTILSAVVFILKFPKWKKKKVNERKQTPSVFGIFFFCVFFFC